MVATRRRSPAAGSLRRLQWRVRFHLWTEISARKRFIPANGDRSLTPNLEPVPQLRPGSRNDQPSFRQISRHEFGDALFGTFEPDITTAIINGRKPPQLTAQMKKRHQAEIHGAWSPLRAKLAGHKFSVMKVETESLAQVDPFK